MKPGLIVLCSLLLTACTRSGDDATSIARSTEADAEAVRQLVRSLAAGMESALNGQAIDTDSLLDVYYDPEIYYVTAWGWTEPLDSTKSRLRRSIPRISEYTNSVENLQVKVYGDVAYATYILRQNQLVDGSPLDEYLPTTLILERRGENWKIVHAHRSTDVETIQQYLAFQQRATGK
jgi:ketosteroid isomerase-like protein